MAWLSAVHTGTTDIPGQTLTLLLSADTAHIPVLSPLGAMDADQASLDVDILHLETHYLADAQARGIGYHQQGAVLGIAQRFEQANHLPATQNDGQFSLAPRTGHLFHGCRSSQHFAKEELDGADGLIQVGARNPFLIDEVKQVLPDFFFPLVVRGLVEKTAEREQVMPVGFPGGGAVSA